DGHAHHQRQRTRHLQGADDQHGFDRLARHVGTRAPARRPRADCRSAGARHHRDGSDTNLMTRILLVDDHPVVRQGIKQVLAGAFHPALVGEASNAEEGMTEIKNTEWDVMVLDLSLPGTSGLDLLKDLRRERPTLPVLVLSMHSP